MAKAQRAALIWVKRQTAQDRSRILRRPEPNGAMPTHPAGVTDATLNVCVSALS